MFHKNQPMHQWNGHSNPAQYMCGSMMVGRTIDNRAAMCSATDIGQCHEEGELIIKAIGENQEEVLFG
jgi:hypothetical protein